MSAPAPPTATARVEALDALRGLALCGILPLNMIAIADLPFLAGPWQGALPQWLEVTAHQRFFPMFAFLFGLSTALILDGAAGRTTRPWLVLLRRLLVLGVLGAAHGLLQPGEALRGYALVGLVVLLPASWLPRPVIALAGAAAIVTSLVFTAGGFGLVPGLLLLGLAAARYGLHRQIAAPNRAAWTAVLAGTVVVAVPLLSMQVDSIESSGFDWVSATAGLVMAVGYACAFVLLTASRVGPWVCSVLAPLGRLALTNYLSATLLALLLTSVQAFSGLGGYRLLLPFAAAILVVQVVASRWWMRHFRYGPVEWVLRSISWLTPVRMKQADGGHPDARTSLQPDGRAS
ncbi:MULTISPECIES: DUF418 domain-containing protein [unclassified Pseudonocardia]|uniref:DUF418 domain-containing protein n=1 Tax=unclassified Pseudonocardia TaxID=2619320 RepID=UPI001CF650B7|nr:MULTISPECIES: DUF418 domain-containing protein [unclassified Pseudonocardia]